MITLRVITWNVRHFEARDGTINPVRAAEAIRDTHPDVIALQEVFHPMVRNAREEYPLRAFAGHLKMWLAFGRTMYRPSTSFLEGAFGNALLSRHPIRDAANHVLASDPSSSTAREELRRVVSLVVWRERTQCIVLNTHLDAARGGELQLSQARQVLEITQLVQHPCVIVGDFNTLSPEDEPVHPERSRVVKLFRNAGYVDAGAFRGDRTYPSDAPDSRIDYIFVPKGTTISRCETVATDATRFASDHLPLFAELAIP